MPNIKSAKKRVLVAETRNARNKANKSALKTAIKKFEAAAVEGNRTEAEGTYKALTPQGWLKDGSVLIRDGKILEVTNCDLAVIGAQLIDVKGMYVRCV